MTALSDQIDIVPLSFLADDRHKIKSDSVIVVKVASFGKDPETRYMSNGEAVTNITLATTDT